MYFKYVFLFAPKTDVYAIKGNIKSSSLCLGK